MATSANNPAKVLAPIRYMDPEVARQAREEGVDVQIGNTGNRRSTTVKREVFFHDARQLPTPPTLDDNGVTVVPLNSAVQNYHNDKEIMDVLYPEVVQTLKKHFGAAHVAVWNHATRSEDPVAEGKLSGRGTFTHAYARFAHVDAGPNSHKFGRLQMRKQCGLSEEETSEKCMDIVHVNIWKPRDYPVAQNPLAVLDWKTLDTAKENVWTTYVTEGSNLPGADGFKIGQLLESPKHKWLFWKHLRVDEALVFKQLDTRQGVAQQGFHTSFDDPSAPPDAPGRRSIELTAGMAFLRAPQASL